MRVLTYREAIREALKQELIRDKDVFLIGEDIGKYGGAYKVTKGLWEEFGEERVMNTPLAETGICGAALGAALAGLRPVAEIMYIDFSFLCMDQIFNQIAKIRYMSGGNAVVPLVIRTQMGKKGSGAAQHSQCLEAIYCHIPGIKVVTPSTPYDAKGLLITAIRENDPVVFIETSSLYSTKGEVPEEPYTIPLGKAEVKREGSDITVVATSRCLIDSLNAAQDLEGDGISVEVIDPRTMVPLDKETIVASVKKTGRLVIIDEEPKTASAAAEIAAIVGDEAFDFLDAPMKRVCAPDTPIPFSPVLEQAWIPSEERLIATISEIT